MYGTGRGSRIPPHRIAEHDERGLSGHSWNSLLQYAAGLQSAITVVPLSRSSVSPTAKVPVSRYRKLHAHGQVDGDKNWNHRLFHDRSPHNFEKYPKPRWCDHFIP
jgi:hypothetical protein